MQHKYIPKIISSLLICSTLFLSGCQDSSTTASKIDLTETLNQETNKQSASSSFVKKPSNASSKVESVTSKNNASKKPQSTASVPSKSSSMPKLIKSGSFKTPFTTPDPLALTYVDSKTGIQMNYALFLPENHSSSKTYPVVLFLHGAGESGANGTAQAGGFLDAYSVAGDLLQDAIVIAPHCPGWWDVNIQGKDESGYLGIAMRLLENTINNYGGNRNRIYVTGLSMGGYGTWQLLEHYPEVFAAGVPLCGWGNTAAGDILADIPIWIYHGTNDDIVNVSGSESMYFAILSNGGERVYYTPLYGVKHNAWNYAYNDREMFCWMFAQQKSKFKPVEETYKPVLRILSPDKKELITERDISYVDYSFTNDGEQAMNFELTSSAAERLYNAHKKYQGKAFSVYFSSKLLYQYKISNPKQSEILHVPSNLNEDIAFDFYIALDSILFKQMSRIW